MFEGIIKKNTRTRTRNILKYILGVARCSYYMKHLETKAIAGSFWGICSLSVTNLLALSFHFARGVWFNSLELIHICSELTPMAAQAAYCKGHLSKEANGD